MGLEQEGPRDGGGAGATLLDFHQRWWERPGGFLTGS